MSRLLQRICVAVVAVALVMPFTVPQAQAARRKGCSFQLITHRFDAISGLIGASKYFIRDNTAFIGTVVDADSLAEINTDYVQSLRDLKQDFRIGLSDIRQARALALEEFGSGRCTAASPATLAAELAFYKGLTHRLVVTFKQAVVILNTQYLAAINACCTL